MSSEIGLPRLALSQPGISLARKVTAAINFIVKQPRNLNHLFPSCWSVNLFSSSMRDDSDASFALWSSFNACAFDLISSICFSFFRTFLIRLSKSSSLDVPVAAALAVAVLNVEDGTGVDSDGDLAAELAEDVATAEAKRINT